MRLQKIDIRKTKEKKNAVRMNAVRFNQTNENLMKCIDKTAQCSIEHFWILSRPKVPLHIRKFAFSFFFNFQTAYHQISASLKPYLDIYEMHKNCEFLCDDDQYFCWRSEIQLMNTFSGDLQWFGQTKKGCHIWPNIHIILCVCANAQHVLNRFVQIAFLLFWLAFLFGLKESINWDIRSD